MDIEEIRKKRTELEQKLMDMILEFETETQTVIQGVDLKHRYGMGSVMPALLEVTVSVGLDA